MNIIELFEAIHGPITPQLVTDTIEQTLNEYKREYPGQIKSARDIGNGFCYEFTIDVFEKLGKFVYENR